MLPPTAQEARRDPAVASEPTETVHRIVRASRAQVQGSAMEQLFAARKRVQGRGGVPGLSGAILHVSGWFVLWQEGTEAAVEKAIKAGRRTKYDKPQLLHRSVGPRTLRDPLALSSTQWPETADQFAERIASVTQRSLPDPRDVWRLLSEPCTLDADRAQPRHPSCRVGLVASDDQRSIEMTRRLAERFRRPLVYRRFAGADPGTNDVGAAYFDLPLDDRPLRVQAVSRRAFGHSLVHESLRGAERIALLVGDQAVKALELAAGIAGLVHRVHAPPAIEVVAQSDQVGSSVREFLQEHSASEITPRPAALSESQLVALLMGVAPEPQLAA